MVGAAAGIGIVAGASTALWRSRRSGVDAQTAGPVDIWSLSFLSVDGVSIPMARFRGKAFLVNFWATWCAPCATEMPLLDAFARSAPSRGWNVLALAVDSADPVRRFLAERALSLPVALAGADGLDLSRSLGNSLGALPFTVVFDANGEVAQRKLGALDAGLLEAWAKRSGA
ncbi:MAG: TlpA disulfide reductase family protein [Caldimonas sp.]